MSQLEKDKKIMSKRWERGRKNEHEYKICKNERLTEV